MSHVLLSNIWVLGNCKAVRAVCSPYHTIMSHPNSITIHTRTQLRSSREI